MKCVPYYDVSFLQISIILLYPKTFNLLKKWPRLSSGCFHSYMKTPGIRVWKIIKNWRLCWIWNASWDYINDTLLLPNVAWGLFHKKFLWNLWSFCRKLQNFCNLWANLWSKFGRNYKSVTYISVKLYGTGPWSDA